MMDLLRRASHDGPSGPRARRIRPSPGGIGRSSTRAAERVSDDLRRGFGSWLEHRRLVGALSLAANGAMAVVSAYQLGLIRRPPEPPLPRLDAERVDASGEAYTHLRTPDATLGMLSYAATLVLASAGDASRSREQPWLPLALLAKVGADAVGGAYLTVEQATKHRRFCGWCLLASAASVAMVPAAVPEALAAWRTLRGS